VELVERDYKIFKEIERWRFCLSRHILFLGDFSSQRICDRRLSLLISEGYINRRSIIYGVPSVYILTRKSKTLISANQREDKIRYDQIIHDVTVLDIAICFMKHFNISPDGIRTEKQLHQEDGFGERAHRPDFIFTKSNSTYCVEVELSLKSRLRLEKNISSNFHKYDTQIWIVGEYTHKLTRQLEEFRIKYPNIKYVNVMEAKNGIFKFID